MIVSNIILRRYVTGSIYDLENLSRKRICCGSPHNFNDPIDTYFYFSDEECFTKSKKILTHHIMDRIRICCFTNQNKINSERKGINLTSNEILMWTHYANAHKGLCFEYDVPKDKFQYIEPNNKDFDEGKIFLYQINYISGLASDFESLFSQSQDERQAESFEGLLGTCFFTKDDSFKYEKEFRLLAYAKPNDGKTFLPLKFDYLKKIIFGERCSEDTKYLVDCINKQIYDNSIDLFQINKHFQEEQYAGE